nr:ATP-binding protein [Ardenticatena sp.]
MSTRIRPIAYGMLLLLPTWVWLFFLALPSLDARFDNRLLHFYLVSYTSLLMTLSGWLLFILLRDVRNIRLFWILLGNALLASFFLVHGLTTPGALLTTFNPSVAWSVGLAVLSATLCFWGAVLVSRPAFAAWSERHQRALLAAAVGIYVGWLLITFTQQETLLDLYTRAGDVLTRLIEWGTLFLLGALLLAAVHLIRERNTAQRRILLVAAPLLLQTLLIEPNAPQWYLSWWMFHVWLLVFFVASVLMLLNEYENLRRFRLMPYYAVFSLAIIGFLTIVLSESVFRLAREALLEQARAEAEELGAHLAVLLSQQVDLAMVRENTETPDSMVDMLLEQVQGLGRVRLLSLADSRGRILLSTNHQQIGRRLPLDAPLDTPMHTLLPEGTAIPQGEYGTPTPSETSLLQSILPVHIGQDDALMLLITDVGALIERAERLRWRIVGTGVALMLVLFMALLVLVYRADTLLEKRSAELRQALASLKRAEQARIDLTRMIVHDLQNPLNIILGSIEMAREGVFGALPPDLDALLARAERASHSMSRLVNDMLEIARLESGSFTPRQEEVHVAALLQNEADAFRHRAEQHGTKIVVEADPALPPACGDAGLITRIVDNLLNNAIRHTEQGTITLRAFVNDGMLHVQVADTGEGIPPEELPHIFDRFRQGKQRRGSLGLGLAFCKMAVEAQGGRIWVESEVGKGTTFTFTLPLMPVYAHTPTQ